MTDGVRSRTAKKSSTKHQKASSGASTANAQRRGGTPTTNAIESGTTTLSLKLVFRLVIIMRCASALYSVIQDANEAYNYWEPTHYLLEGYGLDTKDDSSANSVGSWAFIMIHALIGFVTKLMVSNKMQTFYLIRLVMGACCAFAEARFYRTVSEEVSSHVGNYVLVGSFFSAGMFHASTAFLPSSFSMITVLMAFSYILKKPTHAERSRTYYAVFWLVLGTLLGWPYSAAVGIPFAIEDVMVFGRDTTIIGNKVVKVERSQNWRLWRLLRLVEAIVFCSAAILAPIMAINYWFYHDWSISNLAWTTRGVFSEFASASTEAACFYILKGLLSFNFIFILALSSMLCVLITSYVDRHLVNGASRMETAFPYVLLGFKIAPFYIWFAILSLGSYMEESLFYVGYPLVLLNGAIALFLVLRLLSRTAQTCGLSVHFRAALFQYTPIALLTLYATLSLCRIAGLLSFYRAPLTVYSALWQERSPDQFVNMNYLREDYPFNPSMSPLNVCIGKEWQNFQSNFFLPSDTRLKFIQSDAHGVLPQPFTEDIVTEAYELSLGETSVHRRREWAFAGVRENTRSANRKVPSTVPVFQCDYLIDTDIPSVSTLETSYIDDTKTWEILYCAPFLDANHTPALLRSFWIPGGPGLEWGNYCLLKRRH